MKGGTEQQVKGVLRKGRNTMKKKVIAGAMAFILFMRTGCVYGMEKNYTPFNYTTEKVTDILEKYYNNDGSVNKKYEDEIRKISKGYSEIMSDYKEASNERIMQE